MNFVEKYLWTLNKRDFDLNLTLLLDLLESSKYNEISYHNVRNSDAFKQMHLAEIFKQYRN